MGVESINFKERSKGQKEVVLVTMNTALRTLMKDERLKSNNLDFLEAAALYKRVLQGHNLVVNRIFISDESINSLLGRLNALNELYPNNTQA